MSSNETYLFADDPPSEQQRKELMPAQKLLDWLQHWSKPTISTRDIHIYGPNSIRDRESAISSAQTLVDCGWLVPLKAHRRDMHKWLVVRKPIVHPNVAT